MSFYALPNGCTATFAQGDATKINESDGTFDVVIGSPPYCDARTYGINAQRGAKDWIDFMLACSREACRVSKGLVLWVVAGVTRDHCYWPACEGFLYEWWKAGGHCLRPVYWHRYGIPGSGGKQWFRSDVEYVLALKRPGPLPWAEPTYECRPPKFRPGGAFSFRLKDGTRVNQRKPDVCVNRGANGEKYTWTYKPPSFVNPGNLISTGAGGGGHLGDKEAHENEAPYPEDLASRLIRATCPPGGWVYDPFSGSGTTVCQAVWWGRNGTGTDLRDSQIDLAGRRLQRRIDEGRAVGASPWPRRGAP